MLSAETFRRDGDADADWEAPFGPVINPRGLPCIVFLIRSIRRLHGRAGVSSRLAPALCRYAMNAKADLSNAPSVSGRSSRR